MAERCEIKKITIAIRLLILSMVLSPVLGNQYRDNVTNDGDYIRIISPTNDQKVCIGTKIMVRFEYNYAKYNFILNPIVIELSQVANPSLSKNEKEIPKGD